MFKEIWKKILVLAAKNLLSKTGDAELQAFQSYVPMRKALDGFATDEAVRHLKNLEPGTLWQAELVARLKAQKLATSEEDIVKLYTIEKSGTNFLTLMLANYAAYLHDPSKARTVNHKQMRTFVFPRDPLHYSSSARLDSSAPKTGLWLEPYGYEHFFYRHGAFLVEQLAYPAILLYRNPLDFVVSWYYFRHATRDGNRFENIHASVETSIDKYIATFSEWTKNRKDDQLWLTYEELTAAPAEVLERVVRYLKLPYNEAGILHAVTASSFDKVRAYEVENGPIHGAVGGFFTRNGRIGQWRDELNENDIELVRQKLAKAELSLDAFQIHP